MRLNFDYDKSYASDSARFFFIAFINKSSLITFVTPYSTEKNPKDTFYEEFSRLLEYPEILKKTKNINLYSD